MSIRAVAAVVSLFAWCSGTADGAEKPNVLFIVVDDLNHWVGHLARNPQAKTPNIDRLAKRGVTFTQAHCAAPLCNPSRAAALSGRRPSSTGVYDNDQDWKPAIPVEQTLTTQFLNAGYNVYGAGKIYHGGRREAEWSEYFSRARGAPMRRDPSAPNDGVGGIKFHPLSNSDEEMPDYQTVSYALGQLDREHDKPFFLAVGLSKVHMPFSVPKKYFEMFPLETIELPPHREDDLADVPPAGVRMARPNNDHAAIVASGRWKEAIRAYLATMAFCDAMVGRLLDGFDQSRYRDNTIVVFWGDHGWHFGEKKHWRKFTLWEEATRAPFIWIAPGVTKAGGVCDRPVDFMSIYPTLCDLAGVTKPAHVEGWNIRPLLENPDAEWKHPALTTFHRNNHAVRSEEWRYIRYADGGEELYDHRNDPYEWTNLAGGSERAAIKAELAKAMPQENRAELPRATARAQNRRARTNGAPATAPSQ